MAKPDGKILGIQKAAINLLEAEPRGLRFSQLYSRLRELNPEFAEGSTSASIRDLPTKHPDQVVKESRGLYLHKKFKDAEVVFDDKTDEEVVSTVTGQKIAESDFYKSFAEWIVDDLEECTKAIASVTSGGHLMSWVYLSPRKATSFSFPSRLHRLKSSWSRPS